MKVEEEKNNSNNNNTERNPLKDEKEFNGVGERGFFFVAIAAGSGG